MLTVGIGITSGMLAPMDALFFRSPSDVTDPGQSTDCSSPCSIEASPNRPTVRKRTVGWAACCLKRHRVIQR
jgi:hypothetical protein